MNKYHARKVTFFGETFDSIKEGQRWLILRDREKKREIRNLRRQVDFILTPAVPGVLRELKYVADFVYEQDGKTVIEDVKGCKKGAAYELFTAKKKMLYFRYGILIQEV